MKNTFIAGMTALFVSGSASAAELGGSIGLEFTENAAGNYAAETTLGFGVSAETGVGLAFGGFTFESVAGGGLTMDEWQLGFELNGATVTVGDQGDVFVGGSMEMVGEDTLADVSAGDESVIVTMGALDVMVGFDSLELDVDAVSNLQVAYTLGVAGADVTGAVDHNTNTDETTLGASASMAFASVNLGGVATYAMDAEVFGYEAYVGYNDFTAFANGDDSDMLQNIGLGWNRDFDNLNVYAEGSYNLDSDEETLGLGVSFKF